MQKIDDPFVDACLKNINEDIYSTFSTQQIAAVRAAISSGSRGQNITSSHTFDIRLTIPYFFGAVYLVILGGKDRRRGRQRVDEQRNKQSRFTIGLILLIFIMGLIWLPMSLWGLYILKSSFGIDFFPDRHLSDVIQEMFN